MMTMFVAEQQLAHRLLLPLPGLRAVILLKALKYMTALHGETVGMRVIHRRLRRRNLRQVRRAAQASLIPGALKASGT